jgi:hypothetical protein
MLAIIEDWKKAVDRKDLVSVISMDLTLYATLLLKLDAYGFDRNSLHLIRSFFEIRLNRVKLITTLQRNGKIWSMLFSGIIIKCFKMMWLYML